MLFWEGQAETKRRRRKFRCYEAGLAAAATTQERGEGRGMTAARKWE